MEKESEEKGKYGRNEEKEVQGGVEVGGEGGGGEGEGGVKGEGGGEGGGVSSESRAGRRTASWVSTLLGFWPHSAQARLATISD